MRVGGEWEDHDLSPFAARLRLAEFNLFRTLMWTIEDFASFTTQPKG